MMPVFSGPGKANRSACVGDRRVLLAGIYLGENNEKYQHMEFKT